MNSCLLHKLISMGTIDSDFYSTADINTLTHLRDHIPYRYFWVDKNIRNEENQIYLGRFKDAGLNF